MEYLKICCIYTKSIQHRRHYQQDKIQNMNEIIIKNKTISLKNAFRTFKKVHLHLTLDNDVLWQRVIGDRSFYGYFTDDVSVPWSGPIVPIYDRR